MYHQFNVQQFYVLLTQCIYVFYVDLFGRLIPGISGSNPSEGMDVHSFIHSFYLHPLIDNYLS
jgi:hypothetical protein